MATLLPNGGVSSATDLRTLALNPPRGGCQCPGIICRYGTCHTMCFISLSLQNWRQYYTIFFKLQAFFPKAYLFYCFPNGSVRNRSSNKANAASTEA